MEKIQATHDKFHGVINMVAQGTCKRGYIKSSFTWRLGGVILGTWLLVMIVCDLVDLQLWIAMMFCVRPCVR